MEDKQVSPEGKQPTDTTKNLIIENSSQNASDSGASPQNIEPMDIKIRENPFFRDCSILAKKKTVPK